MGNDDDDEGDFLASLSVEENIIAALCHLDEHAKVLDKKLTARERAKPAVAMVHLFCAMHKLTGLEMDEMKKLIRGYKDHHTGRALQ
jgi:hypothetical protein